MPKVDIDVLDPFIWPCLIILHVTDYQSHQGFAFHALALWNAPYYNPLSGIIHCPEPPPHDWDAITPLDQQLQLARTMIANPDLIPDLCLDCTWPWRRICRPRWKTYDDGRYHWNIPACAMNGDDYYNYDLEYWPPYSAM